ncbi:hypothetical protein D3C75_1079130 [compost metagenome]
MVLNQVVDHDRVRQAAVAQSGHETVANGRRPGRLALAAQGLAETFGHVAVLDEGDSETLAIDMDWPRSEAGKKAGYKPHPFAGMIRIRFEGSPRCSVQRFLSPLPGSPW